MPDDTSFDTLDDAAYQRALAILVDVGTSLAKELKLPSNTVSVVARSKAFDHVSLAVRRTIILSRDIAQSPSQPINAEAKRTAARKHVIRSVDQTIGTKADPADAPGLRVELLERMDAPEFDADLRRRPLADLITELCRDLGLANVPGLHRFPRRTPEDIAILCAQAAAPSGSGLAQWLAATAPQAAKNDLPPTPGRHCEARSRAIHRHPPPETPVPSSHPS